MNSKKSYILAFKIIITIMLLVFLFWKAGPASVIATLAKGNSYYLIPILVITIIYSLSGAVGLWLLFTPFKKIHIKDFIYEYLTSIAIGSFTPGQVGETSIAFLLKKYGVSVAQGLGLFGLDKLLTLLVSFAFSLAGILAYNFPPVVKLVAGLVIVPFIVVAITMMSRPGRKHMRVVLDKFKLTTVITALDTWSSLIRYNLIRMVFSIVMKIIRLFLGAIIIYCSILMFHAGISVIDVFYLQTISRTCSMIPISINGIGFLEIIMVYFFNIIGISSSIILCAMVVTRFIGYLVTLMYLLIRIYHHKT